MVLKQTAEYKRQDFIYNGVDDDSWRVTIIDSETRQYVEISKDGDDEVHDWDLEMLLDIADAIRKFQRKPSGVKINSGNLPSPNIVDHRSESLAPTQAEIVQSSVDKSMSKINDTISPLESMQSDIKKRMTSGDSVSVNIKDKTTQVSAQDVL